MEEGGVGVRREDVSILEWKNNLCKGSEGRERRMFSLGEFKL